jgi:hypothetical protein
LLGGYVKAYANQPAIPLPAAARTGNHDMLLKCHLITKVVPIDLSRLRVDPHHARKAKAVWAVTIFNRVVNAAIS